MNIYALQAVRSICLLLISFYCLTQASGQTHVPQQGCVLESNDLYRCAAEPFRNRLAGAREIAVEANSMMDRYTQRELRHLVERLGKHVAAPGGTADLTLTVVPVQQSAVSIGPEDRPLASLQVYARGGQAGRGTLIWSEVFSGPGDRPWPSIVRSVIDQFESHARAELHTSTK